MDIVERLKQEFSGNALKDIADQTRAYVKERHEAADEIERLQKENDLLQKELKKHLTYQEHRHGRIGTHDPICYEYGPRHYECALREIERLREALKELLNVIPNFPSDGNFLVGMKARYNQALIEARAALKEET